ncbi:MAG: hypothetical protein AB7I42_24225 [Bradyrhizobium sp.]|uniref:hypothetical protein n=1 Tax=Bradyrhizobium sp. TaxID=376 RepID=UPI003D0D8817
MAQTNLRLTQKDIRDEAAAEARFPSDYTTWSSDQQSAMTRIVKRAMRWAFQPQILPGEFTPHLWSWLRPITTITLWDSKTPTASVTITTDGTTAVTSSGSTFYESMIGKSIVAYNNTTGVLVGTVGTIAAVPTASTLTLAADAAVANATYRWAITADGTYRLPVEFIGMEGKKLYHATGESKNAIEMRSESRILEMLQFNESEGQPAAFAVRPVAGYTGAAEQQWELLVGPIPDDDYVMKFPMHLNVDALTAYDGTDKYMPGGSVYTELFRAAALMAVESELFRTRGLRYEEAVDALVAAVHFDRAHTMPTNLGQNRDGRSPGRTNSWVDEINGPDVFVNGTQQFQE